MPSVYVISLAKYTIKNMTETKEVGGYKSQSERDPILTLIYRNRLFPLNFRY